MGKQLCTHCLRPARLLCFRSQTFLYSSVLSCDVFHCQVTTPGSGIAYQGYLNSRTRRVRIVFHSPFSILILVFFFTRDLPKLTRVLDGSYLGRPIKTKSPSYPSTNMVQEPPSFAVPLAHRHVPTLRQALSSDPTTTFPTLTHELICSRGGFFFLSHLHKRHLLLSVLASFD